VTFSDFGFEQPFFFVFCGNAYKRVLCWNDRLNIQTYYFYRYTYTQLTWNRFDLSTDVQSSRTGLVKITINILIQNQLFWSPLRSTKNDGDLPFVRFILVYYTSLFRRNVYFYEIYDDSTIKITKVIGISKRKNTI